MPMRRAVLMTRQAISPRLAIRIFENMVAAPSEREVVVLLPGILELLVLQHGESPGDATPGPMGHDDVVDIAAAAGDERGRELLAVFLGALLDLLRIADVGAEDDLHGALRPHDRDLGGRPRVVDVAAQVL